MWSARYKKCGRGVLLLETGNVAELAGEKAYERVVSAARLAVDVEDLRNGSAQVLEQPHAVEDAEATANSPPRKARSASLESLGEDVRRPVKT